MVSPCPEIEYPTFFNILAYFIYFIDAGRRYIIIVTKDTLLLDHRTVVKFISS